MELIGKVHIISKRAKISKRNHDQHIVNNYCVGPKESSSRINVNEVLIYSLMPPRRSWVSLTEKERFCCKEKNGRKYFFPLDSITQNKERLRITIMRDMHSLPYPKYICRLKIFILDIQKRVNDPQFKLMRPEIIPKKKDIKPGTKIKEIRPICIFSLKDNIIIQEVSGILSEKFDVLFNQCSYAFRCKNSQGIIPSHHDTIKKISEYRKEHEYEEIFVAECDLKKFFDTINHSIIKKTFYNALSDSRVFLSCYEACIAERVFIAFLNVYDFQSCVLPRNSDNDFKRKNKCEDYNFKWIETELEKKYDDYHYVKIGIPQGGALSGLIANLVLNEVDKRIYEIKDESLLYLRYCDDMVMLHTNVEKLGTAFNLYQEVLKNNMLFIHKPVEVKEYSRKFYENKSKKPYVWGDCNKGNGIVPWVAFVGYQVGFKGEIRVRESSIKKEVKKQLKIVSDVKREIDKSKNKSINTDLIKRSVQHRLIGMSVGRIHLFWPQTNNTMCWSNGFRYLDSNHFSQRQMRYLDFHRMLVMKKLYNYLRQIEKEVIKKDDDLLVDIEDIKKRNRREKVPIIYFGKPYSYYGWLERKRLMEEVKEEEPEGNE